MSREIAERILGIIKASEFGDERLVGIKGLSIDANVCTVAELRQLCEEMKQLAGLQAENHDLKAAGKLAKDAYALKQSKEACEAALALIKHCQYAGSLPSEIYGTSCEVEQKLKDVLK